MNPAAPVPDRPSDRPAPPQSPPPLHPEPVALPYLGRRALRFWRSAGLAFLAMAGLALLAGYRAWQPYRSQAVLMFDQAAAAGENGALDLPAAGARLKEMFYAGDRLAPLVARHGLFPELTAAAALEETRRRLAFEARPGGTFLLSFVGLSPGGAQSFLRQLASGLIDDHHRQRRQAAEASRKLLTEERVALEKVVKEREGELARFFARHPSAGAKAPPGSGEAEILLLEHQLRQLRERAASAGSGGGGQQRRAELHERLRGAEAEQSRIRRELEERLTRLTEAHPDVITDRRRLEGAERDRKNAQAALAELGPAALTPEEGSPAAAIAELEAQIASLRAAQRAERITDPREQQLALQLEGQRHNLAEAHTRLSEIQNQELRAELLERREKSESTPRLTALDPGSLPGSPLHKRRRQIALGGLLLAATLAAGLALTRAVLSDRLFDPVDIAHLAGAGVLAVIPGVPEKRR